VTEHAKAWFAFVQARSNAILGQLEAAKDAQDLITVDECPVRAIREVMENGEEVYLGDISMQRCIDGKLLAVLAGVQAEEDEIARYSEENSRRSIGDPEIIWDFGGMSSDESSKLPRADFFEWARLPQTKSPWSGNYD
jgi:hypothetical protein